MLYLKRITYNNDVKTRMITLACEKIVKSILGKTEPTRSEQSNKKH